MLHVACCSTASHADWLSIDRGTVLQAESRDSGGGLVDAACCHLIWLPFNDDVRRLELHADKARPSFSCCMLLQPRSCWQTRSCMQTALHATPTRLQQPSHHSASAALRVVSESRPRGLARQTTLRSRRQRSKRTRRRVSPHANPVPLTTVPLSPVPLSPVPLSTVPLNTVPLCTVPLPAMGGALQRGSRLQR